MIFECFDRNELSNLLIKLTNANNSWILRNNSLKMWSLKYMNQILKHDIRVSNYCFLKLESFFINNYLNQNSEYSNSPFFNNLVNYIKKFDLVDKYTLKLPNKIKGKILAQLL